MSELGLLSQDLSEAVTTANARLDNYFCEAINNRDVEGAMACFLDSPDLIVVLYGTVVRGTAALRKFLADLFTRLKTGQLEINEVTHWSLGDTVFVAGTATYTLEASDGVPSTLHQIWTDARRKVGGRWFYVLYHATRIP